MGAVKQMDNNSQIYQVDLQLTDDDDEQLRTLTTLIGEEIGRVETGWGRLGMLLAKIGQFDKAEELYKILLEQTSDESDKRFIITILDMSRMIKVIIKRLFCITKKHLKSVKKLFL